MHYLRSAHNFGLFATLCVRVHALTSFLFSTTKSWSFINLSNFPRSTAVLASLGCIFHLGIFKQGKRFHLWKYFLTEKPHVIWYSTIAMSENLHIQTRKMQLSSGMWQLIFEKEKIVRKGKHICYLIFDNFQTRKTRLSFETRQLLKI